MKNEDLDRSLARACPSQRADLAAFAATGDPAALVRVHFESCPACSRALDALALLPDRPKRRPEPADDPMLIAKLVSASLAGLLLLAAAFACAFLLKSGGHRHLGFLVGASLAGAGACVLTRAAKTVETAASSYDDD